MKKLEQLLMRTGVVRNARNDLDERGEEFKLPETASLAIIIAYNIMLQLSFFIIISSSSEYAAYLGGSATFSGIVIGVPTLISGMVLVPMTRYDKGAGQYARALHIGCLAGILGHVAYAIAYRANFLYLILIGRCLNGVSFTGFMYCKRYCTDPLIVGIRRRTTLCSWLVIGQALGMTLGPFLGGLLCKIGFGSVIFNGYTSPGWVMACCYALFWVIVTRCFKDVPTTDTNSERHEMTPVVEEVTSSAVRSAIPLDEPQRFFHVTRPQWGVLLCMCWFGMICFFILGSWEANLPVFGAATPTLDWSPFAAGNFIALGGITAFPFFLANMLLVRHIQDRHVLAFGIGIGTCGLVLFLTLLATRAVVYGALFACWWPIALGFNLATTVTLSLLSKQLQPGWNRRSSMAIQYAGYLGRLTGAIWGGSGLAVGMLRFVGLEIGLVGVGGMLFATLWRNLKTKTG